MQLLNSSLPIFLSLSEHSFSFVPSRALTVRFSPLSIPSPPFSGSSSASSIPIFNIGFMSKILSLLSELISATTLSDADCRNEVYFSLCFPSATAVFACCTFGTVTFFPDTPFGFGQAKLFIYEGGTQTLIQRLHFPDVFLVIRHENIW